MGIRYGKRNRMESAKKIPDEVAVSLADHNIKYEKFDNQIILDKINAKLDIQQKKLQEK